VRDSILQIGAPALSFSPVYFEPARTPLRLEDFPVELRPLAQRKCLAGVGSADAPLVMGWRVSAAGHAGVDLAARRWLQEQGFEQVGSQWFLSDRSAR
jgi:hypothetical protein